MALDLEAVKTSLHKKATWAKWGIGLGAVLLLGPLIWILAYAMLGVAALGAATALAGVVMAGIVYTAPVVIMKMENAKMDSIIAEATKNPIPTLWNAHKKDGEELEEMEKAILDYSTEIENAKSQARKLSKNLTAEDLENFNNDIALLEIDLGLQEQDLVDARYSHAQQEVQINRASAIWDLNMAVSKANAKNLNRAEETMAKIKKETALDSVTSSMNRSKAQLKMRIQRRVAASEAGSGKIQPALSNNPSDVIEMETVPTATKAQPVLVDSSNSTRFGRK